MIMLPNKKATAGTASIQNIQRHVGAPNQKISPAPPAILARIALLRNALNSPTTIANCCSEARRPRICAGATSAMYIGANTLAPPMATPAVIRTAMKNAAELAAPVATAVTRNRIAFKSIVGRRPRKSASLPAPNAPTAQPSNTDATAKPVPAASVRKAFASASTVPLITPLSKPKRKPPIAATQHSAITYADLRRAAWTLVSSVRVLCVASSISGRQLVLRLFVRNQQLEAESPT